MKPVPLLPWMYLLAGLAVGGAFSQAVAHPENLRQGQAPPMSGSPITRPAPRLIVQPGKPLIFTSVPQPLGEVPVAITRAPRPNAARIQSDPFWQPIRRGGGLGGVPARFPNVLSPARSYVPETYGPVSVRPPVRPWPCVESPVAHWTRVGSTLSSIGPSGAAFSVASPALVTRASSVGSALASSSGFSADIDLGSVSIHIGSRPPMYGSRPDLVGSGWGGEGSCKPCPISCRPVVCYGGPSYWDSGWWTWFDTSSYYSGPIYGTGWSTYEPTYFYPPSVTNPPDPAATGSAGQDAQAIDELIATASGLMFDRRYPQAAVVLRDYLRRDPTDAGAWRWLGMTLLADRQAKDAVEAFQRAYILQPAMADLPLEYEAMGLSRADLRRLTGPLLVYARNSRAPAAYLMAAVVMDARAMRDQSRKIIDEARDAGLDPALAARLKASFGG